MLMGVNGCQVVGGCRWGRLLRSGLSPRPGLGLGWVVLLFLAWGWGTVLAAPVDPGALDINRATAEQLRELPFIGEVRARAIVEYRRNHGPFTDLDQLLGSEAVGPKTLEAIRPYLRLGPTGGAVADAGPGPGPAAAFGVEAEETAIRQSLTVSRIVTTRPGQVQLLCDQDYYPVLLDFIRNAAGRIELAMFVFRVTEAAGNRPALIAGELKAAARRGVKVEVLLEDSAYDEDLGREHRRLARNLRRAGVEVRLGPRQTTTHTKLVLVDRRFVFLGSHNLTHAALSRNHECSLLLDSRELAAQVGGYLLGLPR